MNPSSVSIAGHPSRQGETRPEAPSRSETVARLRRLLPQMEGAPVRSLPFGVPDLDRRLPQGGLALGALHEVAPQSPADRPAAFGFMAALLSRLPPDGPLLLVLSRRGRADQGRPHGHGLNRLGLAPDRVLLAEAGSEADALWAIEEALRSGVPAAVAGLIGSGIDLKTSQRLQLATAEKGVPLILLRPAEGEGANAAVTRWRIGAAPAWRDRFGLLARWRWQVVLERCRNGRPGEWMLEWDHVAHRFRVAAALADHALPVGAEPAWRRQAG